jgi:hypothetical protein
LSFIHRAGCWIAVAASFLSWVGVRPAHSSSHLRPAETTPVDDTLVRLRVDQPDVRFVRAIAADFDRDGDIDVAASSAGDGSTVWINDGSGHFARGTPQRGDTIAGNGREVAASPEGESLAPGQTSQWWHALASDRQCATPPEAAGSCVPLASRLVSDESFADAATRGPPPGR